MVKRLALFFLLTAAILFLPGCWDMLDIENQGFILTVGFDTVEPDVAEHEPSIPLAPQKKVHLTLEIFSPYHYKQTQGKEGIIVLHSSGASAAEAIKQAQGQYDRKLSLSHLRVVVVGEEYARQGIKDLIESLERWPRIANRFRMTFIQDARAEEVLEARPLLTEASVADIISKTGERDMAYSFHRTLDFTELKHRLRYTQGTAYATRLSLSPHEWISKYGAAVFKDWKLTGWLAPYEVRCANWVTGEIDASVVTVECGDMLVSCETGRASRRIIPTVTAGMPAFRIEVDAYGYLVEASNSPAAGFTTELLQQVEAALAQRIKAEIHLALEKSQKEFGADYLGLGNVLYNKYPEVYNALDWSAIYPVVPVEVAATMHINRLGKKK